MGAISIVHRGFMCRRVGAYVVIGKRDNVLHMFDEPARKMAKVAAVYRLC